MTSTTTLAIALIVVSILDITGVLVVIHKNRRIKSLEQKLATRDGIIDEKCVEIYELEQANTNLDARNARLHHDIQAMRDRLLPQLTPLAVDEDVTRPYIPAYEGREQPWTEER